MSSAAQPSPEIIEQARLIVESFRPFIRADGGDIEFIDVTEKNIVRVRLKGACVGCPSAFMTLQMGVERHLRERLPQIRGVENVR